MKQNDYFFKETALFQLSAGIYQVLEWDCCNFRYFKNQKPNICGLLNRLISELSVYRDDLHENFMRYYMGDTETVRKVENGIYQVYLRSFDLNGDAVVRVPFRVNAAHKASFEKIYEEKLQKYNINFTNYVRTLLGEYAIKPYYQRELFFHYRFFKEMQRAISRQNVCRYTNGEKLVKFIPAAIEPFFSSESGNCLLGVSISDRTPVILQWRDADKIHITEDMGFIMEEEYRTLTEAWRNFPSHKEADTPKTDMHTDR